MGDIVIKAASVWDGSDSERFTADVVVRDSRIQTIDRGGAISAGPEDEVIDASGLTLMAVMVEGHCHHSFTVITEPPELGVFAPDQHTLPTAHNLLLLPDLGFP